MARIDPALYGESAHATTETAPDRDRFEIPLSKAAIEMDLPLFAICRGVQVLNVAAGGSLVQDIPSTITTEVNHAIDIPKDHPAHAVKITPQTKLADALGPAADLESCAVNSRHHQSVGRVAQSFIVSASSPDGVIEAIERPESAFCVGVQWHPEIFWKTGQFGGLFAAFINAATAMAEKRSQAEPVSTLTDSPPTV